MCVYSSRKLSVSLEACASLGEINRHVLAPSSETETFSGIKLIHKPHTEVTHHLTNNYLADLSIATSLLSLCKLVQPEWLNEFIRLGTTPLNSGSDEAPLEAHFDFPSISKFRPTFSSSLSPSQKIFNKWEPNEERVNLFHKFRFICMTEKTREMDGELRNAIQRGEGTWENFDIHSDASKFHQALTRSQAKEGKTVVIIGEMDAIQTTIGSAAWEKLFAEAKRLVCFICLYYLYLIYHVYSFGLDILPPAALVQAILDVDTRIFSESIRMDVEKGTDARSLCSFCYFDSLTPCCV